MRHLLVALTVCLAHHLAPFAYADGQWKIGDKVVAADFRGTWYDAEIVGIEGDKYKVHYSGWSDKWDKVVSADKVKARTSEPAKVATTREVLIEFNGQWVDGSILKEGEAYGVKTYLVKYKASGGEEWIAPNRLLENKDATRPVVGHEGKASLPTAAGANISIEYNGGWYPGKLAEVGDLFGTPIYKVTYAQSGLHEWVAPNRVKNG